ncbi:MAG: DNA polymerase I [Gemmatimonadales bacterium]
MTEANASERLGVGPSQVTDWLALVGDSSDNVPGVRGIGEKGAVQLLREYGDLETLIARAGEIKQKRPREALAQYADMARLSRRLVTIKTDVPVDLDLATMTAHPPDTVALAKLCVELEFHSLLPRLASLEPTGVSVVEQTAPSAQPLTPDVTVVADPAELGKLAARLREVPLVAFDCETSSLDTHEADLIGLSLAAGPEEVWYLPFAHRSTSTPVLESVDADPCAPVRNLPPITAPECAPIRALLEDPSVPKAGHNVKYDVQVLRRAGVTVAGVVYDSMVASFVLDPSRRSHGIDALSVEFLSRTMTQYTDLTGKGKAQIPFAEVPVAHAAAYCGADSATVLSLYRHFGPELERAGGVSLFEKIEMPLIPVLTDMEWIGIRIDSDTFARLGGELSHDLEVLAQEIRGAAGGKELNLNSPRQLAVILFEELGLPVLKKTRTGASTDAEVLEQLADLGHELPRLILGYRELQKLKSTYVDVLPLKVNKSTGRIHTSFSQVGAQTGRLSSSDPNLQNIPVRTPRGEAIRRGFVPESGWKFIVADYSQIELRLMAHLSHDPAFTRAFQEGLDIHRQTAAIIFGVPLEDVTAEMRSRAKTTNFGIIYGQGPMALSKQLGIPFDEAREFIAGYFTRFAGVRAYLDRQVELARHQGYVETLFGRRRFIPELRDRNFNLRAFGERTAQNTPLQGSAADLIKIAMIRIHRALPAAGLSARMVLQVHDELVIEAPAAEAADAAQIVREHMEGAAHLDVPLVVTVGIGDNWVDAKS